MQVGERHEFSGILLLHGRADRVVSLDVVVGVLEFDGPFYIKIGDHLALIVLHRRADMIRCPLSAWSPPRAGCVVSSGAHQREGGVKIPGSSGARS